MFREGGGLSGLRAHEQPAEASCKLPALSFLCQFEQEAKGSEAAMEKGVGKA